MMTARHPICRQMLLQRCLSTAAAQATKQTPSARVNPLIATSSVGSGSTQASGPTHRRTPGGRKSLPAQVNERLMTNFFIVPYEPNAPWFANPFSAQGRVLLKSIFLRTRLRLQSAYQAWKYAQDDKRQLLSTFASLYDTYRFSPLTQQTLSTLDRVASPPMLSTAEKSMHALRQAAIQNPALKHAYYHTEKQRDVRSPKILYRVTSPLQTDVFTTQYTVRFETEQLTTLKDAKNKVILRPNGNQSRVVKENIVFARVFTPSTEMVPWKIIGTIDDAKPYQPIKSM